MTHRLRWLIPSVVRYLVYLYFQLYSHNDVINEKYKGEDDDAEEEEEIPSLSVTGGFLMLFLITGVVAFMSEFLTGSIEEVKALRLSSGLPPAPRVINVTAWLRMGRPSVPPDFASASFRPRHL